MEVLISSRKVIVIWGASNGGKQVLGFLRSINVEPEYFVDSDPRKHGKLLEGIKVLPPSALKGDELVIIGSIHQDEISLYLERRGIRYIPNVFSIFRLVNLKNLSLLNDHLDELIEVFGLLADDESRKVFSSYIKYLLSSSPIDVRKARYPQYFHPIVRPQKGDIIVDGGAFTGDTILFFLNRVSGIRKIFAFEPDRKNFQKLMNTCYEDDIVVPVNAALWQEEGTLQFSEGLGAGSYVSKSSNVQVNCISIDKFFEDKQPPTLIKLDIEGSEKEAILGGRNIISYYKPKLQISIYHDLYHLFEIPLLIKKLNPEYNFYVGHHTGWLSDLILYAI
jgi:FkbM family methyltransferase